ncbi:Aminotransferase-like, plant mobile domain [Sesbania bispinosa]|nr:Aminotransferase-like, plant mobile domain [Sesbania bispinosa]
MTRASFTSCWAERVSHVFTNDPPFVKVMEKVDYDVSSGPVDSYIIYRAKELKTTTIESAKYSREFLAKLCADPPPVSDTSHRKVRGMSNVLLPGQRKVARESLKYTYATWIKYFFGDFDLDKNNFLRGPSLPQPLKRAAFFAFWISKYVFPGPPWESVSSSVFMMACLLVEGVRLPLASFYLGSLYGRLDQIQEQLFSSYGRFPINSFVDLIFLQSFLFEHFSEYALVRSIPDPSRDEKAPEAEPRVWGWSVGRPRRLLVDLIDEEDQFLHHPYTQNFFPGVETLHRLYQAEEFATRNVLPGFIIIDTVSIAGGAFWPYAYRPDRVCRKFGIDRPPCSLDLGFCSFSEAMKVVLFRTSDLVSPFDASKFVPPDRSGRVLDLWVAYNARLRSSVKRYEQQDSMQVFPDVKIMCKDPYFVTTTSKKVMKPAANISRLKGKKRKPAVSKKPSTTSSVSEKVDESFDRSVKKSKPSQSEPIQATPPKPSIRSPRLRKKDSPLLPVLHTDSLGSSTVKVTSGEAAASDRASTPEEGVAENEPKGSPFKEVALSKGINSPSISSAQLNIPQVNVPLSFVPLPSTEAACLLEQSVGEPQEHFKAVKVELDRSVEEIYCLKVKEKEIKDVRASLDAILDF